ncbi:TPA: dATP/dGTP pyrophosphohydrolase domain-containing protein, partial [Citrobacter amalonaticus]
MESIPVWSVITDLERNIAPLYAAMLQGSQPVSNRDELPEEKGASLQLRNLIRRRHAEWSDATFGNVGPVGPLKHLSKEALEAA